MLAGMIAKNSAKQTMSVERRARIEAYHGPH